MRVFVTGTAGFVGFHLARRLIADGHTVAGYDGLTPYYDVALKKRRHAMLEGASGFTAHEGMLEDAGALRRAVAECAPDVIVHLAAQAGVRYGVDNPGAYVETNVLGTFNLLEAAREARPRHLLLASTSAVYGGNESMPFREAGRADFPLSLYGATKKAAEALSHSYAHLWGLPTTCLRLFTVYGPWGRPDMALYKFVAAVDEGRPIDVYGEGRMTRDFTYIDDAVESIVRLAGAAPELGLPVTREGVEDSLSPAAPWRAVNIGGGQPVGLMDFITAIEKELGKRAVTRMLPMQQGDVSATEADDGLLHALTGYRPRVGVKEGVAAFVEWYRSDHAARADGGPA